MRLFLWVGSALMLAAGLFTIGGIVCMGISERLSRRSTKIVLGRRA